MQNNGEATKPTGQSGSDGNVPYVGPRPFMLADQDIFFGRKQESIELTSLVKAHTEVLVFAPSGAGKTSLLFADVLPALGSDEEFDVLPGARVRSQESSAIPEGKINNIYMFNALKDLSNDGLGLIERSQLTLADYLARRQRPALSSNGSRNGNKSEHLDKESNIVRVITFDQFEEIFTLYPERYKDRQNFFCQIADALKADSCLRVIFSMREDYIAELEPYLNVLPQNLRTKFRLERLRERNALSAVKSPLETERIKKTGRYFADGAAELLVKRLMLIKVKTASGEKIEALGEFVDPVQLQVVCQTLWEKLPPNQTAITTDDIDKYANVDKALSDFYENCIRKSINLVNESDLAGSITEGDVRGWFEQKLITPEGKRNMVYREGPKTAGLANLVVDELENQHVIRREMRGGEPWYELSHDRFITPIREANRRFVLQQPVAKRKGQELEERAAEWLKSDRSDSLLLNRGDLADAQNWMETEAAAIGYTELLYSFIQASKTAIEHEDNKQRQLLADEQRLRIIAERQRVRQMRLGFVAVSVLLLLALGSWFSAYQSNGRAQAALADAQLEKKKTDVANDQLKIEQGNLATEKTKAENAAAAASAAALKAEKAADQAAIEKKEADKARGIAEKAQAFANTQKHTAIAALGKAQEATAELCNFTEDLKQSRNNAWSLKLAGDANKVMTEDPEKGLSLAILATDKAENEETRVALRQAFMKRKARRVLRGHESVVWKAAYGPQGLVITISEDRRVGIWNPQTNSNLRMLAAGAPVHGFAISKDGKWLATEEANNTGRIWNLRDGTLKVIEGLSGPVAALAMSPDDTLLATEATTDDLKRGAAPRIWEVSSGKPLTTLIGHDSAVVAIVFGPSGDRVATASWDGTGRIWDVKSGRQIALLQGHTAPLTSIAFDKTGQRVVTGSFDGTARIWDVATGHEQFTLQGHSGVVHAAIFSPDNNFVLTTGKELNDKLKGVNRSVELPEELRKQFGTPDNTARLWDVHTGKHVRIFRAHTGDVNSAAFSSDGRLIVTAGDDGVVLVWDVESGAILSQFREHKRPVNSAVFSPDNNSILTASSDNTSQIWQWNNDKLIQFAAHDKPIIRTGVAPNGSIMTSSPDGNVRFWAFDSNHKADRKSGGVDVNLSLLDPPASDAPGRARPSSTTRVYDVALSPKGNLVVMGSKILAASSTPTRVDEDHSAYVWDVSAQNFGPKLAGHTEPVTKILFSSSGRSVATMSAELVQVWNTSSWKSIPLKADSRVLNMSFTPDEESLLMVRQDGTLVTTKLKTGEKNSIKLTPTYGLLGAVFNSDGTRIAGILFDRSVGVWDTTGIRKSTLKGAAYLARLLAFSPDSTLLITAGFYDPVRVWRTDTGEPIAEFEQFTQYGLRSVAFNGRNDSIVAGDELGRAYVFECEFCQPFAEIKRLAKESNPRELSPEELEKYLPGEKQFSPPQCKSAESVRIQR